MPTTSFTDAAMGVSTIGARTDAAGVAVTDWSSDEARLINEVLTEGFLTADAFVVQADSPASMDVIVGSGTSGADIYVVDGDDDGQHNYPVRLDSSGVTVTIDASDASNSRIDEIWLVVLDNTYDSSGLALPRIAYRKGDAGASPSAPGADASWKAAVKLATVTVGAGVTSITAGNIADNRAAADLNIGGRTFWHDGNDGAGSGMDADTVDGFQAAALAKLAGGTFTGAVTFDALATFAAGADIQLSDNYKARPADPDQYPDGLSMFKATSTHGWPAAGGMVLTVNNEKSSGTVLQWYMTADTAPPVLMFRRWLTTSSAWSSWETVVTRENPSVSSWEVDNSTEVASSSALTGSLATAASVTLSIPSDWGSWKCFVEASFVWSTSLSGSAEASARVVIDGTAQQTKVIFTDDYLRGDAISGHRAGMTTTGNRTVSLQATKGASGDSFTLDDVFLYARAVRTS